VHRHRLSAPDLKFSFSQRAGSVAKRPSRARMN
jgi:hypothetical protein